MAKESSIRIRRFDPRNIVVEQRKVSKDGEVTWVCYGYYGKVEEAAIAALNKLCTGKDTKELLQSIKAAKEEVLLVVREIKKEGLLNTDGDVLEDGDNAEKVPDDGRKKRGRRVQNAETGKPHSEVKTGSGSNSSAPKTRGRKPKTKP